MNPGVKKTFFGKFNGKPLRKKRKREYDLFTEGGRETLNERKEKETAREGRIHDIS
jgi:hypothetical protein